MGEKERDRKGIWDMGRTRDDGRVDSVLEDRWRRQARQGGRVGRQEDVHGGCYGGWRGWDQGTGAM